jgi:hypothetical protein
LARVQAPLLSLKAHGQIGHAVIYEYLKGASYARAYGYPKEPWTQAQLDWQDVYRQLMLQFAWLKTQPNGWQREAWDRWTTRLSLPMFGFPYWIHKYISTPSADRRFFFNIQTGYDEELKALVFSGCSNMPLSTIFYYIAPELSSTFLMIDSVETDENGSFSNKTIPIEHANHFIFFQPEANKIFALSGIYQFPSEVT